MDPRLIRALNPSINNFTQFRLFMVRSTGAVISLPRHYATHPVFGFDLVPYPVVRADVPIVVQPPIIIPTEPPVVYGFGRAPFGSVRFGQVTKIPTPPIVVEPVPVTQAPFGISAFGITPFGGRLPEPVTPGQAYTYNEGFYGAGNYGGPLVAPDVPAEVTTFGDAPFGASMFGGDD